VSRLSLILIGLIVLLQYRLWFSDDGVSELDRLETRLLRLKDEVARREERNASLEADVRDLKEGNAAVEERARQELGMIRDGEVFVQIIDPQTQTQTRAGEPARVSKPEAKP
jgi:cell division protein FtsB